MTANDCKSYLSYLNKLVDQYNNTYHHCIGKKTIETNSKAPKFKVNDGVKITKCENIFSKGYTENRSREIFIIDYILKNNPWTFKIKDLNEEKIRTSFYEKKLLLSIL